MERCPHLTSPNPTSSCRPGNPILSSDASRKLAAFRTLSVAHSNISSIVKVDISVHPPIVPLPGGVPVTKSGASLSYWPLRDCPSRWTLAGRSITILHSFVFSFQQISGDSIVCCYILISPPFPQNLIIPVLGGNNPEQIGSTIAQYSHVNQGSVCWPQYCPIALIQILVSVLFTRPLL